MHACIYAYVTIGYCIVIAAGQDFSSIYRNTLSFSSGDGVGTMRYFTVGISDDTRVENDERFTVSLSSGSRTRIAQRITTINIHDNDGER